MIHTVYIWRWNLQFLLRPLDVTNITMTMRVAAREELRRGCVGTSARTADMLVYAPRKEKPQPHNAE